MEKHLIEKYKNIFIPGIKLNEMFYQEAVRPVMKNFFPSLPCSAALIGSGSDILGFDNPVSVDHDWGPKVNLFLKDEDYDKYRDEIDNRLKENLPLEFLGFSVNFSDPDWSDGGTMAMEPKDSGPVNHKIGIFTLKSFFESYLGINPYQSMKLTDWLTFTEQSLLEVTGGKVYYDGLDELNKIREKFSYYPEDIWLYKMACQWQRISQEEPFMGRCGECGDKIGSHIIAARLVRDMMKLSFLMEKKYAPYNKWFGTAFGKLVIGKELIPLFDNILKGKDWKEREKYLCKAYLILAEKHNTLKITGSVEVKISNFFERPYKIILAGRFVEAIKKSIKSEEIKSIKPYIGSVDQYIDSTDLSDSVKLTRKLKILYK